MGIYLIGISFIYVQMVEKGYYEDLIETWRKTHSQNDIFTTKQNESCYVSKLYLNTRTHKDQVSCFFNMFFWTYTEKDEVSPGSS